MPKELILYMLFNTFYNIYYQNICYISKSAYNSGNLLIPPIFLLILFNLVL